jgi:DNA polymerase-3 subunit epsilon
MPAKLGVALPVQIAVFDTETDSVNVETGHIVSAFVGVMDVASGNIVERWSWLLNTGHPIPKEASDVHKITTERMMAEGSDPKRGVFDIYQRLDILAKRGLMLVAMNASFDFSLLDREIERHWPGMRPLFDTNEQGQATYPWVFDPMIFDRAVDKYRKGSRKLVDLAAVYGVPVETNAHDAEADCRMVGRIAIKLLKHSRLADLTPQEVHMKLIPTARNNALGLAAFWRDKKMKTLTTQQERADLLASIHEVETNGIHWPVRPRPETKGAIE